tara:strand:- start:622 stop:1485 length:864 start_codon:yes stop_codon:yes gene_type:complete
MVEFTYQWNPEWEEDPAMPQLKVTKSSLNTLFFCEKQYEFQYIQGRRSEPNAAMARGSIVHNSYEDFYNDFDLKKAEGLDDNNIFEYCISLFPIDENGDIYRSMAAFESERFLKSKQTNALDTFLPVGNEIKCNAKFEIKAGEYKLGRSNPFTLQRDYIVHLQGIIDRVFQEGNSVIPVELKTGIWKDSKATHMRHEMAFYKVLMEADPDCNLGPITHWAWYYPDSNYFQLEEVKKYNVNQVHKRIAYLIHCYEKGIFKSEFWYNKCKFCSFTSLCDSAIANHMWEW